MQFRAEEYFRAGLERMTQARVILGDGQSFALAMYCGGLAVECVLRAFRFAENPTFQGRHDLMDLLKSSGLLKFDDEYMHRRRLTEVQINERREVLKGAMNEVYARWNNNLRYASEASAKAFLKKSVRSEGVRGDPLKENARMLIEAAQTVVDRGATLWTSEQKS